MPVVILAHGLLGGFDEIIFVSIALVFVGMMGISWYRSQQMIDDEADDNPDDSAQDTSDDEQSEHFELK